VPIRPITESYIVINRELYCHPREAWAQQTPHESAIHVIEKQDDRYADTMLVFLVIDHLLFNTDKTQTYTYEEEDYYREVHPVIGINNIVTYEPYEKIIDVPNYVEKIKSILDPSINSVLLNKLYEEIPSEFKDSDGLMQIDKTVEEKTLVDVLDIFADNKTTEEDDGEISSYINNSRIFDIPSYTPSPVFTL